MVDYDKPVDEDETTVKINASPYGAWFGVLFRQISLMGGAVTAVWQFISAKDIKGLFAYMATHEFLAFVVLLIATVSFFYGYVREWLHKKKLLLTAIISPKKTTVKGSLPGAKDISTAATIITQS